GIADTGNLRVGISAAGDALGSDRAGGLSGDQFGHHDAFMAGLMRKPGRAGEIANRIQPLHRGPAIFIDLYMSVLNLDAQRLKPEVFDITDDADGSDDCIKLLRPGFAIYLDMR